MRQYGSVPPWLAADNTPQVSAIVGLGTGGGAAVQTPDSGGFGSVDVFAGPGALAAGSVALTFPSTPPTLFIAADEAFGPVTQETVDNVVTISWTAASLIARSTRYRIYYEWETSL